jgi:peroxiredoxin
LEYQKGKVAVIEKLMAIDQVIEADSMAPQNTKDSLNNLRDRYLNEKGNYDSAYILKYPGHLLSKFLVAMINVPYPEVFPVLPDGTKDSTFPLRWYKNHYLDHMDFGDDGLLRMPVNIVKQRLDFYFDKIIVPDADTCMMVADKLLNQCKNTIEMEKYLIWYLTNRFESSNIMGLDRAFVRMAMSTYCQGKSWWVDSATITKMCENAFRRAHTLIGETAPELELKDIKGNWVNTQKIRGPYVVMIFWDPTCGHCKEVMPKLAKIYQENKDKGWKVIALSSGDKKKEWEEYYNSHPETQALTHLIRGEVQSQKYADALYSYYVVASPTIYVLDADRKIVANRIDVDKMVEFLKHLDEERAQKAAAEKKQ